MSSQRERQIERDGIEKVRQREKRYRDKHREEHYPFRKSVINDRIEARLENEGYTKDEAIVVINWLRGEKWKDGALPATMCKCRDGYICEIHWLDKLRAVIDPVWEKAYNSPNPRE